ncbi:MAG TPA: hypothetical protein VIL65_04990 [Beijerinckiaceae bacterium]|jgi:uncharacterized protein YcfJ
MRTFVIAASTAALLSLPTLAFGTESGAAAGATTGAAAGAVVGGPVGAVVGAGAGAVVGGAASGPDRKDVVIEQRGSTTGSVGCSTTTKQTSDASGTTTKQRTDC